MIEIGYILTIIELTYTYIAIILVIDWYTDGDYDLPVKIYDLDPKTLKLKEAKQDE